MRMSVALIPPTGSARRAIGTILRDGGLISLDDISRVLAAQKQHKAVRFGEAAIRLGLVSEDDVRIALARQFEYTYLRKNDEHGALSEELIAACDPTSPRVDDLRAVRSHLLLHWLDKTQRRQTLTIVGAESGEGRSHSAANLAIVFAQIGERTLLIDADLRQPRQHKLFQIQNALGLSTMLARNAPQEAISRIPDVAGLFVLPAGPVPPNPLELLSRKSFSQLLETLRTHFDVIIIDTSGLNRGEDAVIIAAQAGAALAIARTAHTRVPAFAQMIKELIGAGVSVVGSILNETPVAKKVTA